MYQLQSGTEQFQEPGMTSLALLSMFGKALSKSLRAVLFHDFPHLFNARYCSARI